MELKFLIPPLTGFIIGYLTNFVAIKLLFKPLEPKKIFTFKLQGIIPKRREEIALTLAQSIEKELLGKDDIIAIIDSLDWTGNIEESVNDAVTRRLSSDKIKNIPILGFLSTGLTEQIQSVLTDEIISYVEERKESLTTQITEKVDIKALLKEKINSLDLTKFEELLTDFITRELRFIEWIGGVMGLLIGIAQSLIFYFFFGGI